MKKKLAINTFLKDGKAVHWELKWEKGGRESAKEIWALKRDGKLLAAADEEPKAVDQRTIASVFVTLSCRAN